MKFNSKLVGMFQEGGPMPGPEQGGAPIGPEGGAPAEGSAPAGPAQGGADQMQQMAGELVNMLMQQLGDPQAVTALLQMALEMVGQAGGGAPAFQRIGGKLTRIR